MPCIKLKGSYHVPHHEQYSISKVNNNSNMCQRFSTNSVLWHSTDPSAPLGCVMSMTGQYVGGLPMTSYWAQEWRN